MPTRLVRKRLVPLACAFFLSLSGPAVRAEDPVQLSLPQARDLAAQSLQSGRPDVALRLGRGLLLADPRDPVAHYIVATAEAQSGRPRDARRAAARAYRFATPGSDRLRAAELAARMAYSEGRPTLAQIWLRRAAIHAETPRDEDLVARDYRFLRSQNPWSFRIRGDIRPSDNVNNGADTAINMIDGIPDDGTLPPSALALSGTIASTEAALSYRLHSGARSATSLIAEGFLQRVWLSDKAKAQAPMAENSDFSASYAGIGLRHAFAVGPEEAGGSASVELSLGESRYGGQRNFRLVRIEATRAWMVGSSAELSLSGLAERRFDTRYLSNEATILGVGAGYARELGSGDTVTFSAFFRDSDAEYRNGTYRSASLRASYGFAEQLGSAKVTASVGLGQSDYPSFQALIFRPPSRRTDTSYFGDLSLFFPDYDYAGFAPTLRFRLARNRSNVSAYSTRESSVSLGIQSKF